MKENKMLKHNINLVVGDWSKDGHGMSSSFRINSNLSLRDLEESYKKGVAIVGLDLVKKVCKGYEDNVITKQNLEILKRHGIKFYQDDGEEYELEESHDKTGFYVSEEDYVIMFMFLVKQGYPLLKWEFGQSESINIGGYGLFR